ncbi:MAG: hypothetical protein JEZ07_01655 [Phycisphaerae bacterium]|nr:hypothetical protein [Phycisphaerae bacterium]
MKRIMYISVFISIIVLQGLVLADENKKISPELGINLAGPADWNTELPFVDVFRLSRKWISQQKGQPWGKGPALELDSKGWVKKLKDNCWAETLMCTIDGGHYPSGNYTVLYEGKGRLEFGGSGSIVSREPGKLVVKVDSKKGTIFLRLMETDATDPVHDIKMIMPGYEKNYQKQIFHPSLLKRWKDVKCIRFMDWMETNGSDIVSWSDRPELLDATYSAKGIPVEVMVELCNRLKVDAWFCMPHKANDDYIRNFARYVNSNLAPELKVYVEYSNEVWNSMFAQNHYAQQKAKELALGNKERPWEGGGMYYAKRSVEIFKIFRKVFDNKERVVRVLAWQSGNTWWMENVVLTYEDAYKDADALAIAPYIGMGVPANGKNLTAEQVAKWTVNEILDFLEKEALPKSIKAINASKQVADKYGLELLAYEGGQHMVGIAGGENNEQMNELFYACNSHQRMGEIYTKYFDAWEKAGGGLFCYFSSVSKWSKWGSWGALQYWDDNIKKSPKYKAVMDWGQKIK